jgi:hypothetical protein
MACWGSWRGRRIKAIVTLMNGVNVGIFVIVAGATGCATAITSTCSGMVCE